ncbi:hypothetical protein D3C87_1740780 [compost metagenome]
MSSGPVSQRTRISASVRSPRASRAFFSRLISTCSRRMRLPSTLSPLSGRSMTIASMRPAKRLRNSMRAPSMTSRIAVGSATKRPLRAKLRSSSVMVPTRSVSAAMLSRFSTAVSFWSRSRKVRALSA